MTDFEIIPYHPRYLAEVSALYGYDPAEPQSSEPLPAEPQSVEQDSDDFETATDDEQIWLAIKDDRVAGFASYFVPDHFLDSIFVDPALQRSGIGRALVEHLIKTHGPGHRLKVEKENTGAISFYERLAFNDVTPPKDAAASWLLLKSP